MIGTVISFEGCFGFIKTEQLDDAFFHRSDVSGPMPEEGDSVEYEARGGRKGYYATSVKVVTPSLK